MHAQSSWCSLCKAVIVISQTKGTWFVKNSSCVLSDKETKILNIIHETLTFGKKYQSQTAVAFYFAVYLPHPAFTANLRLFKYILYYLIFLILYF